MYLNHYFFAIIKILNYNNILLINKVLRLLQKKHSNDCSDLVFCLYLILFKI